MIAPGQRPFPRAARQEREGMEKAEKMARSRPRRQIPPSATNPKTI